MCSFVVGVVVDVRLLLLSSLLSLLLFDVVVVVVYCFWLLLYQWLLLPIFGYVVVECVACCRLSVFWSFVCCLLSVVCSLFVVRCLSLGVCCYLFFVVLCSLSFVVYRVFSFCCCCCRLSFVIFEPKIVNQSELSVVIMNSNGTLTEVGPGHTKGTNYSYYSGIGDGYYSMPLFLNN